MEGHRGGFVQQEEGRMRMIKVKEGRNRISHHEASAKNP